MLRSKTEIVPSGVRIIAYFSFLAGFWFISQSLSIFMSASVDNIVGMVDGIVNMSVGVGFTYGARWAWTLRVIVSIVVVIESALILLMLISEETLALPANSEYVALSIAGLVINPLILYYLYRPHAKAYFGKVTSLEYLR
jgi:hypothetical protein